METRKTQLGLEEMKTTFLKGVFQRRKTSSLAHFEYDVVFFAVRHKETGRQFERVRIDMAELWIECAIMF